MTKSKSPQPPAPPATNIQIVCQEPIIVPRDAEPAEESPPPAENAPWPRFILIGGTIAVLMFFRGWPRRNHKPFGTVASNSYSGWQNFRKRLDGWTPKISEVRRARLPDFQPFRHLTPWRG